MKIPEYYMQIAFDLAEKAGETGEIPVGAVIVSAEDEILASGCNRNRSCHDVTMHAEMEAIREASHKLKNERLNGCSLFVTKEPCVMCLGAIIHSRIARIYIGAADNKYGACGTAFSLSDLFDFNHRPEIIFGILEEKCSKQLTDFFRKIRLLKKSAMSLPDNGDTFV